MNGRIQVTFFDLLDRMIDTVVKDTPESGYHSCNWNDSFTTSGIYTAQMQARQIQPTIRLAHGT